MSAVIGSNLLLAPAMFPSWIDRNVTEFVKTGTMSTAAPACASRMRRVRALRAAAKCSESSTSGNFSRRLLLAPGTARRLNIGPTETASLARARVRAP
jgi:hypothetical protein